MTALRNFEKKILALLLPILILLLGFLLADSAEAAGYSSVYPKPQSTAEKKLLTAEERDVREDECIGVRACFSVDTEALLALEEKYYVTFGALVSKATGDMNAASLTLVYNKNSDTYTAPQRATMITVYSTQSKRPADGLFLTEAKDSFAVTVSLGNKSVERTEASFLTVGFMILEDKSGSESTRVLYVTRYGSPYGNAASFERIMREDYLANKEKEGAEDVYISFLQEQMKAEVASLSKMPVYVCGKDNDWELTEQNPAIWVQYLPDHDPYKTGSAVEKNIRAAYIYYPTAYDPSVYSDSELAELGAMRVFAYIGTPVLPKGTESPGLVCVHGGGGHAYAQYALEAVRQGYAAVAIDTEGGYNTTGGNVPYSAADTAYPKDDLGHAGKDHFADAEAALTEQWLYYAVCDTVLANSVLRAMDGVDENAVGITGISWGGLITSTSICYDHRFAFAVPIYISFHMAESKGVSVGGLKGKPFAAALWQDEKLLAASPVPTLIISSENDLFASVGTVSDTVSDLENGALIFKPGLTHSQQHGASLSEIYRFGYFVLGKSGGFIAPKEQPTALLGRNYTLTLSVPEDIENVQACLYYRTEPIKTYDDAQRPQFIPQPLTVQDGRVTVDVAEEACLYFISFHGYSDEVYARKEKTPYISADQYERGSVYSSTDIIYFP